MMYSLHSMKLPFLPQRCHSMLTKASNRVRNGLMRPAISTRATLMPTTLFLRRGLMVESKDVLHHGGRRGAPCVYCASGFSLSSLLSKSSTIQGRLKLPTGKSLSTVAVPSVVGGVEQPESADSALAATSSSSSSSQAQLLSQQYVAVAKTPKLKPHIVRRRLARLKVYTGTEKNIRHSPWRLNLVCQLAAGLPLTDALTQLQFCDKWAAPLVQRVLQRTANLADIRDGLQPSQLEVAECFATRGTPLKRMKPMGRGRTGRMEHRHSHMRTVLREIDFKLKVYQAPTLNQKKRWLELQAVAQRDGDRAKAEREEIRRLEKKEAEAAAKAASSGASAKK